MGLFSKLKNVLFEEEEIEVPIEEEPKRKPKVELTPKVEKKPVKPITYEPKEETPSIMSDRELFKAEKTFDFPVFDDQEFESMKKPSLEKEEKKNMSINLFDYDKKKMNYVNEKPKTVTRRETFSEQNEIKGRAYNDSIRKTSQAQKFHPSPVISPVYGVLDKNYKKEDIIVEKEVKKQIDVDDVRKKAFGTLEEDIEKTLNKPIKEFYEEEKITLEAKPVKKKEEKSIEDLLEESAFDSIELPKEQEEPKPQIKPTVENKPKKEVVEDTLESDLFDLIDSMYEDKEEE